MGRLGVSQNTGVLVVLVAFALEKRFIRWLLHLPHGFWFIFRHNRCCQLRDRDRKGRKKDRPTMVTDSDHRKQPHFNDLWVRLEATRSVKNEKLLLLMIIIIIVIVTDIILFCFLIHYILNCFKETWLWYTFAFSMVESKTLVWSRWLNSTPEEHTGNHISSCKILKLRQFQCCFTEKKSYLFLWIKLFFFYPDFIVICS